jgi:hypothetical protein
MASPKKASRRRDPQSTNLPAVTGDKTVNVGGRKFTVTKQVTLPLLKHGDGQIVTIKVTSQIYIGRQLVTPDSKTNPATKPADLVRVIDLLTGRPMIYIVSAVVKSTFETEYPDNAYVGKSFAIHKLQKVEGKRYKGFEILEIEDNGEVD